MTISFVGAAAVEATSISTMPTHVKGDLIVIVAHRIGSTTLPTVPSGWWVQSNNSGGGTGNQQRATVLAWKVAASNSETSGTWTNASLLACVVYRDDANYLTLGGRVLTSSIANTTSVSWPTMSAVTSLNTAAKITNGNTWVLRWLGVDLNNTDAETAQSGFTARTSIAGASAGELAISDTNSAVASVAAQTQTVSAAVYGLNGSHEIMDTGIAKSSASFRPVNIRGGADQ
jgi:hypothetical protein